MTKNLISATQQRIEILLTHIQKIQTFPLLTYNEQTQLMYELRVDSVELNGLLETMQTVYKRQNSREVK